MSRYWSDVVGRLTPYVPGEQPRLDKLVTLNSNEFPYPPSPRVLEAIAAVPADALRRYPDPESTELRQAFADRNGLDLAQVFVGNGSDEVLAHVFQALLKHDRPLLFPATPIAMLKVGWSVVWSNSTAAFDMPSVVKAYVFMRL